MPDVHVLSIMSVFSVLAIVFGKPTWIERIPASFLCTTTLCEAPSLSSVFTIPYWTLLFGKSYIKHSAAATAAFIAFSCPILSASVVIFPVLPLLTTPVIHPPFRPIAVVSVKTVDDSIS